MASDPKTLQDAIEYFASPVNCREYLVSRRWRSGVVCPKCGSKDVLFLEKYERWHCREKHDAPQFTLKTGTVMEDSPLPLKHWLLAMWMVVNCKNGVSSYEIHRATGVTQKSAWFMNHRIRLSLGLGPEASKLSGEVEADETLIGAKARNMHLDVKDRKLAEGKTIVAAVLERGGKVRAQVVKKRRKAQLESLVRENVEEGAALFTDELKSYEGLGGEYVHQTINHAEQYVNGRIHTNGMENFWSLLKRGLHGTYVSVEPFHLFRYLDEQCFRFNNRKLTDGERFSIAVSGIVGKRLTYDSLIGKDLKEDGLANVSNAGSALGASEGDPAW